MRGSIQPNDVAQLLGGPPRLAFEDIVRHPRLPQARKAYIDRFLDVYDGDPFLVRLLIETGRFSLFMFAAILEAGQDPARRETWLTIGRLKQAMTSYGFASGRHVDQLIGRLCAVGFMERRLAEQDRRVRILKATEKLWAHDRDWLAAHFAPLAACYPRHDYGPVLRSDRQLHAALRRTSANPAIVALGGKLLLSVPDMNLFLAHAGGFMVIVALLQGALATGDQAQAAVPYADAGDRFGISRTHVRRLLGDAEAAGLVKLHARGGRRVELLPRLWASFDRGMATGMYFHDILYVATIRQRDGTADSGDVLRLA